MADERGCGGLLNLRAAWRRRHRPMRGPATESADLCFTWNSRPICRRVRHPTDSAVAAHRIGLAMTGLHAAADDLRSSGAADPADADGAEPPPNARPTPHVRRYAETGAPAVRESRRVVPPRPVVAADPCALLARVDAYTGGLDSLVPGTGCLRSRPATVSATGRAEATRRPRTNQPPQIGECRRVGVAPDDGAGAWVVCRRRTSRHSAATEPLTREQSHVVLTRRLSWIPSRVRTR